MFDVVMALSGGMDSTTVLGYLLAEGLSVDCIGFTYGAKHNKYENVAATNVADHYNVKFQIIDLSNVMALFESNLLKTGGDIPEGHYADETMSQTVVPGRNIIFLSILAGRAWTVGAEQIAIGIHQGDHAIYPDCRKVFFDAMNLAIHLGTDEKVEIIAPFLDGNKTTIIKHGLSIGVPYGLTRTCYKDQQLPCGKCGACVERLEAFANNNIEDPVTYEAN